MKRFLAKLRSRTTLADVILAELRDVRQRQIELTALQQQTNGESDRFRAETEQQRGALRHELAQMRSELAQQQEAQGAGLAGAHAAIEAVHGRLARLERTFVDGPVADEPHPGGTGTLHVHFFFQMPETWTTWESVWRACAASPDIEPTIVLLPFIHGSAVDPSRARRFLAARGLSFVDFSAYRLNEEQPDLVFLQNPYDSTRPPELAVQRLLEHGVRIAYIPYGLDVGGGADNLRWQYDLEVQRSAWRIFVRSEQQRRMYGLHCLAGNRNVVVTGHPKIDNIVAHRTASGEARPRDAARTTILWCPHFTVENGGWSTFMALHEAILGFFEREPADLCLVVRPHPLFFGRLNEIAGEARVSEQVLRRRLRQPPWIVLDEEEDYTAAFLQSDALMTDAGSFLLEYLPTGKPILYLHHPDGPGLNESAGFVDSYYRASDFAGVQNFLEMVRKGGDPQRDDRVALTQLLLHRTDGTVGQQIVDHIAAQWRRGSSGASCPDSSALVQRPAAAS